MADIRIKDLPTTATQTASDDFIALDGTVNGTRKIDASAPSFKTSVTSPSIVAPAATALTLAGGSTGASLVLGQGASGIITLTPNGGYVSLANAKYLRLPYDGTKRWDIGADFFSTAGELLFAYNGVTQASFKPTGNLLIGTTTDMTGSGGLKVAGTTSATSSTAGAFLVGNGTAATNVAIGGGNVNAGGTGTFGGSITATSASSIGVYAKTTSAVQAGFIEVGADSATAVWDIGVGGSTHGISAIRNKLYGYANGSVLFTADNTGVFSFLSSTPSTLTTNGALVVTGGVGVGGAIFAGGTVNGGIARITTWALDNSLAYFGHSSAAGAAGTYAMLHTAAGNTQINGASTLTLNINNATQLSLATGSATFVGAVSTTNGNITLTKTGSDATLTLNGGVASYALATFNPNASTTNNFAILAETGGAVYFQQNNGAATKMTFAAGVNGGVTIATGSAGITSTGTGTSTFAGAVSLSTAGTTISIKSGANAAAGTVTLVGGTATITSTAIDVNTVIVMSVKTSGGTIGDHTPSVKVNAGNAVITGSSSDTSTYNWVALKVN